MCIRDSHITIPLAKIHRHVVDALTIYPYHSVNSIDTWPLVCNMMLALHLVSPGPFASVCLFIVLSLSLPNYRNSVGTVFLNVSFPNDNTETFGKISTPFLLPGIVLSTILAVLV